MMPATRVRGETTTPNRDAAADFRTGLVDAAIRAAGRGWCVFPVRPGDKRPAFPNHTADACDRTDPWCRDGHVGWEQRATTDTARIRTAWNRAPYNVGLAAGPSGLIIIDLDVPKPDTHPPDRRAGITDGADELAALCENAGEPYPCDTYTVATPSGGTHLYFRHPAGGPVLRNTIGGTAGALGALIDTRGHGGYVLAAGSVIGGCGYEVVHDVDPAPLPGWLADRLTPAPIPDPTPVVVNLRDGRAGRYAAAALADQTRRIAEAAEGGRNQALFVSATALGQLVAGGLLDEATVRDALTAAALDAGLTPGEAYRTIGSGLRRGANRPRQLAA